jgi:hypothetical protein
VFPLIIRVCGVVVVVGNVTELPLDIDRVFPLIIRVCGVVVVVGNVTELPLDIDRVFPLIIRVCGVVVVVGNVTELPLDIDRVFPANDNVCAGVLICTVFHCCVTCVTQAPTIVLNSKFAHTLLLNIHIHHPILDAVFISPALPAGNSAFCISLFGH